ncbi:activating signal cointegrator 1 complex subunit 3-like [Diadema antillarum]|uniref:activating signal cointegrator 1 complex subunit 3-like n=1 Tax=Diadema antillarum TaxID=105358 RepID=UPI003A84E821
MGGNSTKPEAKQTSGNTQSGARASVSFGDFAAGARNASQGSKQTSKARSKKKRKNAAPTSRFQHDPPRRHCASSDSTLGAKVASQPKHRYTIPKSYSTRLHGASVHGTQRADLPVYERVLNGGSIKDNESDEEDSDDEGTISCSDVDEDVFAATESTYRADGHGQGNDDDDDDSDDDGVEKSFMEERMDGDDADEMEFDLHGFAPNRRETSRNRRNQKTYPHIYDYKIDGQLSKFTVVGEKIDLPSNSRYQNKPTYEEVVIPPPEITTAIKKPDLIPVAELDKASQKAFRGMETLNLVQTIVFDAAYNTDENLLVCAPTGAGKTNVAMLAVLHEVKKHIQQGVVKTDEFKIVYVAPMKALAAEMVKTFGSRLRPLGISVKELTGDSRLTKREIMQSQMLVVTPEKWDVITRKCTGDATIIQLVKLLIIDEVHLLHEDRGAVIECLVARTLRQVEAYQNNVRIVGLSATLPNYRDVAEFLHVDLDKGLFFFDSRFRPVPLQQSFIGVKNLHSKKTKEKDLMNDVCYEKMIELVKNGHQVLIFVFSRAGTRETADELLKRLKREPTEPFSTETHESFEDAKKELEGLPDQILMDLVPKGLAVHHGGISRQSRDFVEKYFSAGLIRVLCCTTTLAWGVNLPAHAVIIKGTKFYNPDTSTQEDLGILDVLQIFGRAGRPQFDTFGEGYIITSRSKLRHYLLLLMTQDPIESKFKMRLADNLNAEIVLGTVSNMEEALRWLRYTYLYIRMRRNPEAYKLSFDDVEDERRFEDILKNLVTTSARFLQKAKMIKTERGMESFEYTEIGRIASHFYVTCGTIQHFNQKIPECRSEEEIFAMICGANEFMQVKVRQAEEGELRDLLNLCELYVSNAMHMSEKQRSTSFCRRTSRTERLKTFSLVSDMNYIAQMYYMHIFTEPTKLDVTALWNNEFQKLFDFRHFNAIQQSVFDQVYTNSDGNVLLGAPSYSGKIVVAELAMLALFKTEPWSKVVYIAPLRALAMRRFTNWKSRFGDKLGKKVRMLNGDVISDASTIRFAEVIVTTAANWEAVSRTWETVRDVSLIILDGLQFLGDECGPILEAIVARAKRMSKHTGRVVRLIGLSATMANAKDVARWLEVDDDHLFNFQSVHRPVKLELKVTDFSGKFCHIRTAAMNKPVYNAIKTTKKGVLVFVSSRKQATATAFELIAFLRHEENPQMWCRLKKEEVEDVVASVSNQNLQRAVSYGIGMHHPGLSWSDRRTVEKLYRDKHLKVIVATKSLAWSSDLRARLVIVKGTEQYDARTQRYVDMPVTDLLQMIGRAGRYKKDSRGTALVMVQNTKRDFYHKALRAPVTIESRPDSTLPEYVNAEVVLDNIKTEQDFENLLKTTFFYTRLTANPSYYGLPGTSERALKKFLSDVMESTLADLSNTQCIRRHKDEDHSVSALPLGRIASQNHVHHDTVKMVRDHLKPDSSIQDILTIISNAVEFAVMPVRYDEENINRTLSGKVRYPIDAPYADFTSPHTKANLLLQAHIGRVTLPCTDYESDTRNVLEYTGRILKVLVEIADMWKWYQTEINVTYLTQAVVQAQWSSENSLLTLPHVQPTLISSFVSQSGSGTLVDEIFGKEIESLKELISVCRGDKSALHAMLDGKLHQNQIKEIWNVLEKLPEVHVDMELRPRSCDGSLTNFPVMLQESQDDEKEVQYRASVLPNQDYRLDVILTTEHQEGINTVYAPHYPKRRNVGWRVMLRDVTTNQLLASRKVGMTSGKKMGSLNFRTPSKTGIMVNSLHLVSDCYLGLDQDLSIFLNVQDSTGHQPNTDASCKTSNAKQNNVEPIPRCDNEKGRDDGENKAMGKENPDKPALAKGKRSRASKGKSSAQRRGSTKSSACPNDPRLGEEEQPGNETKPRTHPGKGTSNPQGQHLKSGETRMESQENRVKPKEDTLNGVAPESSHGGTDVQDGKTESTERTMERKRNGEEKGAHHRDQTQHSTEKFHTAKPAQPEFSGKGPAPNPDALQLDVQKRRLSGRKPRGCTKGIDLNVQDPTGDQPHTDASLKTKSPDQGKAGTIPRRDYNERRDDVQRETIGKETPDKPPFAKRRQSRASKGKSSAQRQESSKSSDCPGDPCRFGKEEHTPNETKPRTQPGKGTSNPQGQHLKNGEPRRESQGNLGKPKEDTVNGVAPKSSHGGTDVHDGKTEATEKNVERKRNGKKKAAPHRDQTPHSTEKPHTAKPAQPEFSGKGPGPRPDAGQPGVKKSRLSGRNRQGSSKSSDSPKDACRLGKEEHTQNETKPGTQPGKGTSNPQGQHLKNEEPRRESQGNRGKPKADTLNGVAPESLHRGTDVQDGRTEATEKNVERKRNDKKKGAPHQDKKSHSTDQPHTAKPAQPEFSGKGPGSKPDVGQLGVKKRRPSGRKQSPRGCPKGIGLNVQDPTEKETLDKPRDTTRNRSRASKGKSSA